MNNDLEANSQFDWSLVRSFLAVLEHGSLLGAARALSASQPTLGRHISELEAQLGTALFERTGRGLLPTAMALQLADAAREMESGAMQLARISRGFQSQTAGRVRISASQPVACVLLPPVLAQMRLVLPEISIELVVSNAVSNLLKREADIALRMVQPDQGSLIAKKLGQISIGTYAHRDYLRRRGTPKQPVDLLQHDIVTGDQQDSVEPGFRAMGHELDPARFALRTDDLIAYLAAIRSGIGIGFVADYLTRGNSELVPLLPMLKLPSLPLWLVVHREIRGNRRIKAVFDFLAKNLPKHL